jgi:hypothetical protein
MCAGMLSPPSCSVKHCCKSEKMNSPRIGLYTVFEVYFLSINFAKTHTSLCSQTIFLCMLCLLFVLTLYADSNICLSIVGQIRATKMLLLTSLSNAANTHSLGVAESSAAVNTAISIAPPGANGDFDVRNAVTFIKVQVQ